MDDKRKFIIFGLLGLGALLILLFFIVGTGSKEYTVAFNSDGGSAIPEQKVKSGEKVVKPTDPEKENYKFVKWLYDNVEYDFNKEVTSDMTLVASWEEIENNKYDVVFVVDGVEKTLSISELNDEVIESLGYAPKEGYVIKWYLNDEEYDFEKPLTEGVKLVGKYVKEEEFTVKFNSDGGTKVDNQKLKLNEKVSEPAAITKEGYIFSGWYLNNVKYDFTTPVTKSITLVAKWEEDPNVKRYEVKFDSDGGSSVAKQRVIENKTATQPKNPTRNGFSFDGWYLDNVKYDFKTKVTKDITLKAKWVENVSYTVTFNTVGGSNISSQKVKKGGKATQPVNPTKKDYKFIEWLLDNNTYDFNKEVTKDIELVAYYEKIVTPSPVPVTPTPTPAVTATPTPAPEVYTITATRADNMASPDSILKVYKNGSQISFKCIKFTDGVIVDGSSSCGSSSRNSMTVLTSDIAGETSFIVVLNDNREVRATK